MDLDFLLIRKMKQGDDASFDVFVRKYYDDILKYCALHCPDTGDAQDLTQETFVRFFANLSDYRFMGKTKNFLYTIAGNLCKNAYRSMREIPVEETYLTGEEASAGALSGPEGAVVDRLALAWALEQLSPQLREVIELYYYQEKKLSEIAEELEIGLPLVKYRMRQAKKQLRELLEKEGSL